MKTIQNGMKDIYFKRLQKLSLMTDDDFNNREKNLMLLKCFNENEIGEFTLLKFSECMKNPEFEKYKKVILDILLKEIVKIENMNILFLVGLIFVSPIQIDNAQKEILKMSSNEKKNNIVALKDFWFENYEISEISDKVAVSFIVTKLYEMNLKQYYKQFFLQKVDGDTLTLYKKINFKFLFYNYLHHGNT